MVKKTFVMCIVLDKNEGNQSFKFTKSSSLFVIISDNVRNNRKKCSYLLSIYIMTKIFTGSCVSRVT